MSDCCIAKAAAEVGRIRVKGIVVGISNLNGIFASVNGLVGESLRAEILKQAAIYNYIPKERREDYADSLIQAYLKWRDPNDNRDIR